MKTRNLIFLLVLALLVGGDLWAIPAGFNIQGRLTDANGVNKDGTFQIKFSVFAVAEGGAAVWEKAMSTVTVKNGNFQVILQGEGDIGGQLEDAVKNLITAYVEIKVGTELPLVPRQPLLRSPFGPSTVNLVGAVMFFAGPACPSGWILANGAVLPGSGIYSELVAYLQDIYGVVGQLPNMVDGTFIRATGGNSAALGTKQGDAFQGHTHEYIYPAAAWTGTGDAVYMGRKAGDASWLGITANRTTIQSMPGYGTARANTETRPLNYAMTPCVKY